MSHHKVLSLLLVSHSICSSSLLCLSAKSGSFQFPWSSIACAQNVRAKNITLSNPLPLSFFVLLISPFFIFLIYLQILSVLKDTFQFLAHHVWTKSQQGIFPLQNKGLSACLLQFPLVLTAFNLLIPRSPQAKVTVPFSSLTSSVCKCFIQYVVYCISCGTLCDPSQLVRVLWRWAVCVNQSNCEASAQPGQTSIKEDKWHPHAAHWGYIT